MPRRILFSFLKSSAVLFAVVAVGLFLAACSSDKPASPTQPQTPIGGSPTANFTVTVTASPSTILANGTDNITIQVTVRDNTGAPPVEGASAILQTNIGSFVGTGGSTAIALGLEAGRASAKLSSTEDGTGTVRAEYSGVFGHAGVTFGDAEVFVSSVDPNTGDPNGGEEVRIRGGGFTAPATVTFDGIFAQVLSVSPGVIRVRSPAADPIDLDGASQKVVNLSVGTAGRTIALAGAFTYSTFGVGDQPFISSINPSSGPNEGGTVVTVRGQNFESPVEVSFGNTTKVVATNVSFSPSQLVVESPPATGLGAGNENSTVDVTVKNINSGREGTLLDAFTYGPPLQVNSVDPSTGTPFGGDTLTINGSGFAEPLLVDVAGFRATVVSVTDTEIVVTTGEASSTGCADVVGEVVVTSSGSGLTSSGGPSFTYKVSQTGPVLTGILPTSGTSSGGTTTTISGSGLDRPIIVLFDSIQGSVTSQAATSAKVRTPGFPVGSLTTTTCDDNMDLTIGEKYLATSVGVTVEDTGTGCQSSISGLFTYNPADGSCRGD